MVSSNMVIEKVHGLQATGLSLNERFTMLAAAAPDRVQPRPRRRPSFGSYFNQNTNFNTRNLANQIARRLEFEVKRQALRQRIGSLRRFGSETNISGMRRSNSFGNLSQSSVKHRVSWRQSNGNLSRSASFDNLSTWRGFRRRRGFQRGGRGRSRGAWQGVNRTPNRRPIRGRPARGGRLRGGARGGITRNQKQVPSKEELDEQLDRYMAASRAALDKDLDAYMKNAMELE